MSEADPLLLYFYLAFRTITGKCILVFEVVRQLSHSVPALSRQIGSLGRVLDKGLSSCMAHSW